MSGRKAKAPVKAKATPTVPAPAAAPVADPTPVVAAAAPAPVAAAAAKAVDAAAPKRKQTTKTIDTHISPARTRRHMDQLNLNHAVESLLEPLKEKVDSLKYAKERMASLKVTEDVEEVQKTTNEKGETVETKKIVQRERDLTPEERKKYHDVIKALEPQMDRIEADIEALGRVRTRFSNEAGVSLSIISDMWVTQLATHAMDCVISRNAKMIQPRHLYLPVLNADGTILQRVEDLPLYPLFGTLSTYSTEKRRVEQEELTKAQAHHLDVALKEAEKNFKKKYAASLAKKKPAAVADAAAAAPAAEAAAPAAAPAAAAPAAAAADDEEDDDSGDSKTTFKFYVGLVCKALIKSNQKYQVWAPKSETDATLVPVLDKHGQVKHLIKISTDIRRHLSELVIEFIARISNLTYLTAQDMKNKTISSDAVLSTVHKLLVDGHQYKEDIVLEDEMVPDPVILAQHEAKKDETKKAIEEAVKAGKPAPAPYTYDENVIPLVKGRKAVRTITYPTSGFAALRKEVTDKLALLDAEKTEKKAVAAAAKTAAAAAATAAK